MFKNILASILLAALFTGCAFQPQEVKFAPQVSSESSQIGSKTSVYVQLSDDRDGTIIGHRGTVEGKHAAISAHLDLIPVIKNKIEQGLQKHMFTVSKKANADAVLSVELRTLSYDTSSGLTSGGIHLNALLYAHAKKGTESLDKKYRFEDEKRVQFAPTAEENEKYINETLAGAITELLNDKELMEFLAK